MELQSDLNDSRQIWLKDNLFLKVFHYEMDANTIKLNADDVILLCSTYLKLVYIDWHVTASHSKESLLPPFDHT